MLIYPSIDLYEGKVVGLYRGDYDNLRVYYFDPMEVVDEFIVQRANSLNLVDLQAYRTGRIDTDQLKRIKSETSLFVQVGGGVRNMGIADRYISAGADRVVIGSAALRNEGFVREAVSEFHDKIAVAIDIKDGFIAPQGHTEKHAPNALEFALRMQDYGVETLICTDMNNAGTLRGVDRELFQMFSDRLDVRIIASGGVSSLEDILDLQSANMYGAIVGKAYYDGAIYIKEAIRIAM